MFWYSISNRFCWFLYYSHCNCITGINLCRWFKYAHCQWCYILSMEYRSNNSKHISKSDLNDHLFCYWNKFKWMFRHRFGNGFGRFIYCSYCNCITGIDLCGRFKYTYS